MGYEQLVPPIPDRQSQLLAMQALQASWLAQPYWKYYMNESLRQPKMAFSKLHNKVHREFFFNILLSALLLTPLALLSRRWFLTRGGIPITNKPNYFDKVRTDLQKKTYYYTKWTVTFHILGSFVLGKYLTDFEQINDINYEFMHKTKKIM